jgi:hypothetical protein
MLRKNDLGLLIVLLVAISFPLIVTSLEYFDLVELLTPVYIKKV